MSSREPARIEATVTGLVQGVFFRQYTLREALQLNLVGWVANRPDGSVQLIAEGDETDLRQLLVFLHAGSPSAQVEDVTFTWSTATGEFTDFRVRYL